MIPFCDRFQPLNELVRRSRMPLISRTVVIGGVAMLDWDRQQSARFGADTWGHSTRSTEDIDIVIAAADDRGWLEALHNAKWERDTDKRYRWRPPQRNDELPCVVDLLGQYGGDGGEAGGSEMRLRDYWGGEEGAYICRVLRAYQGKKRFPTMLTEAFWDPMMSGLGWRRLNHIGLVLSKITAVGIVLQEGDSEHQRGLSRTSRLGKDLQDLRRLLRDEVRTEIDEWQGEAVLEQLVDGLADEVMNHRSHIVEVAAGTTSEHLGEEHRALLVEVADRLPEWRL